jgi:hypothetical protein
MTDTYSGGCHCGKLRFKVDVDEHEAIDCNCSICTKKGFLHVIVPLDSFRIVAGQDELATYTFGTHTAKHHFCRTCGTHAWYLPRSHPGGVSVNLRALDRAEDRARFRIKPFDGENWEENVASIRADA